MVRVQGMVPCWDCRGLSPLGIDKNLFYMVSPHTTCPQTLRQGAECMLEHLLKGMRVSPVLRSWEVGLLSFRCSFIVCRGWQCIIVRNQYCAQACALWQRGRWGGCLPGRLRWFPRGVSASVGEGGEGQLGLKRGVVMKIREQAGAHPSIPRWQSTSGGLKPSWWLGNLALFVHEDRRIHRVLSRLREFQAGSEGRI
jgi:hypothetical protein